MELCHLENHQGHGGSPSPQPRRRSCSGLWTDSGGADNCCQLDAIKTGYQVLMVSPRISVSGSGTSLVLTYMKCCLSASGQETFLYRVGGQCSSCCLRRGTSPYRRSYQSYFVPKRLIMDNIFLICEGFWPVDRSYLFAALKAFRFGEEVLSWVKLYCHRIRSGLRQPIPVQWGVRQGFSYIRTTDTD